MLAPLSPLSRAVARPAFLEGAAKIPRIPFPFHSSVSFSTKSLAGRVQLPAENKQYWVLQNVLPQNLCEKLSLLKVTPALQTRKFRDLLPFPIHSNLLFSPAHCWENDTQVFLENYIADPFLEHLYKELVHTFAKQMKLTGTHEIYIELGRYNPAPDTALSQSWHYDRGALATMIVVLHNDFTHTNEESGGLDISFNAVEGPFNPLELSTEDTVQPLNEDYISVKYPKNGAIIVAGEQGHVIHKMSTLAPKIFSPNDPCHRIVAVIELKDPSWKPQASRKNQHYLSGS